MTSEEFIKLYGNKKQKWDKETLYKGLMSLDCSAANDLRLYKLLNDIFLMYCGKSVEKAYHLAKKRAELYQDEKSYFDLADFYLLTHLKNKDKYDETIELAMKARKEKGSSIIPSIEDVFIYNGEKIDYRIDFCARYSIRYFATDLKENKQKIIIETFRKLTQEEVFSFIKQEYEIIKKRDNLEQTLRVNQIADIYEDPLQEIKNMFFAIQAEFNFPIARLKMNSSSRVYGSCCPKKGLISLNMCLIHRSKEFIRYVIIHEYCHFYHNNHSKEFWHEVEKRCPDYRKYEHAYKRIY